MKTSLQGHKKIEIFGENCKKIHVSVKLINEFFNHNIRKFCFLKLKMNQLANLNKTAHNRGKNPRISNFGSKSKPRNVKTANTKPASNEGRLYLKFVLCIFCRKDNWQKSNCL